MKASFVTLALTAMALPFGAGAAKGDVITPSSAFASTYYSAQQAPGNLINDSGLDTSSGDVLTYTHATHDNAVNMWHAGQGQNIGGSAPVVADQYVVFDLGNNYDLSLAYLWQMVQPSAGGANLLRGIEEFRLLASPDAPDPTDVANPPAVYDTSGFTEIMALEELAIGTNSPATTQVFSLAGATNVRQIYLDVVSAHSGATNEYVGLSEVKFEGTLVPEPSSLWLALAASGLVVAGARQARRAISTGTAP